MVYVRGTMPNHISLKHTCPIKIIESSTSILPILNIGHSECGNVINIHVGVWRILTNMIIAYGISFLRGFLIVLSIREAYCSYLNGNQGLGSRFGPHPKAKGGWSYLSSSIYSSICSSKLGCKRMLNNVMLFCVRLCSWLRYTTC